MMSSIWMAIASSVLVIYPCMMLYKFLFATFEKARSKSKLVNAEVSNGEDFTFLEKLFIDMCVKDSRKADTHEIESSKDLFISKKFDLEFRHSGVHKKITDVGFSTARIKFMFGSMGFGALFGFAISPETSLLFAILAGFFGFRFCLNVFQKRVAKRTQDMQNNLHEMLDILLIGVRAGLSFDRGLKLYTDNFNCTLSTELKKAQNMWESSLMTRDEALRSVADSYDSILFLRLVESICRSLNLGTSLEECLQSCAVEAKAMYKAERETKIQKAPVKMMIPTATLILPAMLILVLGPVLLEFINGSV